jgi:hypothetical protein
VITNYYQQNVSNDSNGFTVTYEMIRTFRNVFEVWQRSDDDTKKKAEQRQDESEDGRVLKVLLS